MIPKCIVGLAAPDHTVPYGTVLLRDALPSTSCLATIMLSLWDKKAIRPSKSTPIKLALMGLALGRFFLAAGRKYKFRLLQFILIFL